MNLNDPLTRVAVFEIMQQLVTEGRNIIFVSHDANCAAKWCQHFSQKLQTYGLLPKGLERTGVVSYRKFEIIYEFPIPIEVPSFWTHPISWFGHWIKRAVGAIVQETYTVSIKFVYPNMPEEALYGYHGLIYYDDDLLVPDPESKFWQILFTMNTEEKLWMEKN